MPLRENGRGGGGTVRAQWWERIFRMIYVFVWFRRLRSRDTEKPRVLTGSGYGPDAACFRIPGFVLVTLSVTRIYLLASPFFSPPLTDWAVEFVPIQIPCYLLRHFFPGCSRPLRLRNLYVDPLTQKTGNKCPWSSTAPKPFLNMPRIIL